MNFASIASYKIELDQKDKNSKNIAHANHGKITRKT